MSTSKVSFCLTFFFSLIFICYGLPHPSQSSKKFLIDKIVQRISEISSKHLSNVTTEEKLIFLNNIERKLKKAAVNLGPEKERYIDLIMKGFVIHSYVNNNKQDKINKRKEDKAKKSKKSKPVLLRHLNKHEPVADVKIQAKDKLHSRQDHGSEDQSSDLINFPEAHTDQREEKRRVQKPLRQNSFRTLNTQTMEKDKLVKNIADKLKILVTANFKSGASQVDQQRVIAILKEKFRQAAAERRNQSLGTTNADIKSYTDVIGMGLKLLLHNSEKERHLSRRFIETISDDIMVKKPINKDEEGHWTPKSYSKDNAREYKNKDSNALPFKLDYLNNETKLNVSCDVDINDTCVKIKQLNMFVCDNDSKVMHISKICDGSPDCEDSSDEVNCARQALECVQKAAQVLSHIDASDSQGCYKGLQKTGILSKQNAVFRQLLQKQLDFVQMHSVIVSDKSNRRVFNTNALRNSFNDVTNVVNALRTALETTVCVKNNVTETQNSKTLQHTSDVYCHCIDQNCIRPCSRACDDMCRKKYSLGRFQCYASNGQTSVALDLVCDGKVDCIDETDESKCFEENSMTKYEANEMYNHILKLILDKMSSKLFESIRKDLISLHGLITKLQKLTLTHYDVDVSEVKHVRNSCFKELTSTYSNALRYNSAHDGTSLVVYIFLLTLNEKLISAMKRSHIGNDKIIAVKECVCRGYECAFPSCIESCKRACAAEPNLTRYFCNGSKVINDSVPIEYLCNGRIDCAAGDDEKLCTKEVCRSHHLKVLRLNLRDAGEKYKGTDLGKALISWKKRVIPTLEYNETRPSRSKIIEILNFALHDLVKVYSTTKDYRRENDEAFDEFRKWSQVVMDTARSCT